MVTLSSLKPLLENSPVVLGLDAYGVIYDNAGVFDSVRDVFKFCDSANIDIYMMTNNATQSIDVIYEKMKSFGIPMHKDRIISSGCGCYMLDHIQTILNHQHVFVYGYESSRYYVEHAGGIIVEQPQAADVIVFAASHWNNNHLIYKNVHDTLLNRPTMPVICINPDHYVMTSDGFMNVMGYYTHQMALQLDRTDWIWMGKPYSTFSTIVSNVLLRDGHDPKQLVFCDDNPKNVLKLTTDLQCQGVVITATGVAQRYPLNEANQLYQLDVCRIN